MFSLGVLFSPSMRFVVRFLAVLTSALVVSWTTGALFFDGPSPILVGLQFFVILVVFFFVRGWKRKLSLVCLWFVLVLAWWLMLKPRSDRNWQPDVAQTAWAEVHGDDVTLHNVRNFDYRTATDFTPHWETRTVHLSQITAIDVAVCYWGSECIAHPIASFQFADSPPVCFSIETRKEVGESYSALRGFFRQYELIYVVVDERDAIRLRTNVRTGEEVYLYRLKTPPDRARGHFLDYIAALNELHDQPRWYNAATANCTTSIRSQQVSDKRDPWDWRILINGKIDELLFERGDLKTDGVSFPELKAKSLINEAANAAGNEPDFSKRLRFKRPGFSSLSTSS